MNEKRPGNEDPLRRALRELPRVAASPGFTHRVVNRSGETEVNRNGWKRYLSWPRLAAAAALLALVAVGFVVARAELDQRAYASRRAALERQHDELRRELAEIRDRATRPTRLYLGSAPEVDLVLDLDPWIGPAPTVRPASYSTQP